LEQLCPISKLKDLNSIKGLLEKFNKTEEKAEDTLKDQVKKESVKAIAE